MNQPPNRLAVNLVIWPILIESIKKHAIYGQIKGSPTVYMCVPIQLLLIAWNGFFSNFRNEILFFLRSFHIQSFCIFNCKILFLQNFLYYTQLPNAYIGKWAPIVCNGFSVFKTIHECFFFFFSCSAAHRVFFTDKVCYVSIYPVMWFDFCSFSFVRSFKTLLAWLHNWLANNESG